MMKGGKEGEELRGGEGGRGYGMGVGMGMWERIYEVCESGVGWVWV